MQIGEPHRARLIPSDRGSGEFIGATQIWCGAPNCGTSVATIRRDQFGAIHVVQFLPGFAVDQNGVMRLSSRAQRQWALKKRERVRWRDFVATSRRSHQDGWGARE